MDLTHHVRSLCMACATVWLPFAVAIGGETEMLWREACGLSWDGGEFLAAYQDGTLVVVDVVDGQVHFLEPGERTRLISTAWTRDGMHVAVLDAEGKVQVRRLEDGAVERDLATDAEYVYKAWRSRSVHFVGDDDTLLVAGGSSPAQLWRWQTPALVADLKLDDGAATACAVSHDGALVALGNRAGQIGVWDARSGKPVAEPRRVEGRVAALAMDPAGRTLAVGGQGSKVLFFTVPSLDEAGQIEHDACSCFGKDYDVGSLAFSSDGESLLTGSCGSWAVCAWDVDRRKRLWCYDYGGGNPACPGGRFTQDGSLAILSLFGVVVDSATGEVQRTLAPMDESRNVGRASLWVRGRAGVVWLARGERLMVFRAEDERPILDLAIDEIREGR